MDTNISTLSKDDIIRQHSNLVKKIALKIISKLPASIQIDDLIQVGMMALLDAAHNFDIERGASFETYAGIKVRGAMIDEVRRENWLPRSIYKNSKIMEQASTYMANNFDKNVSISELCSYLNISEAEYSNIELGKNNYKICYFDDLSEMDNSLLVNPGDKDVYANVQNNFLRHSIDENIKKLPLKERLILVLYYNNELSLKQIGDILSITESRVCQIHAKAMHTLEKHMTGWRE